MNLWAPPRTATMTELEIDQSHLPRVQKVCQGFAVLEDGVLAHCLQEQEIEQHYSWNVQKRQLVQRDLRVAKSLQHQEERGVTPRHATSRLEEQDFEYACMIQEEIQRRAEEARKRERDDKEVAKRIQEEEVRGTAELKSGCHGKFTRFPLSEGAELELGSLQQVLLDHELAWRLQEAERDRNLLRVREELTQSERGTYTQCLQVSHSPPLPPSSAPEGDSRVAQVAQDEEIARFMQRQEMKTKRRSCDMEGQGSQQERREAGEKRESQELKVQVLREEPPSPSEERTQPSNHRRQPIRNIAEELDPTFKARRKDIGQSGLSCSDLCQAPPTPGRGFHDYTEEPLFIPPTKRQSGQSGRGKAKEKKEGCKQQ